MKHVTTAEKSLLLGDEAADLLIEYAAILGDNGSADTVNLNAYGDDGDPVLVTFLLNSGTELMVETSDAGFKEPDNEAGIGYMRDRIAMIEHPPQAQPMDPPAREPEWDL